MAGRRDGVFVGLACFQGIEGNLPGRIGVVFVVVAAGAGHAFCFYVDRFHENDVGVDHVLLQVVAQLQVQIAQRGLDLRREEDVLRSCIGRRYLQAVTVMTVHADLAGVRDDSGSDDVARRQVA